MPYPGIVRKAEITREAHMKRMHLQSGAAKVLLGFDDDG